MGNRNDKFGMNIQINIEDKNADAKLAELGSRLAAAGEEAESAQSQVRYLEDEIARLKEVIDNLESATGVDIIKEKLRQFKESAQEAVSEFRAFLQVVKLNDSEGTNDAQFAELFEKIRTGALTANQAILQVKTDMRSLIEENFIQGGGGGAAEIIQSFSAALNHLGETCSTILAKLQDLSTNGIPAAGTAATSGAGNIAAALEEIRSAAGAMAGDVPTAYEQMTHLFEAVTAYATIDADKLYHVSEAFRGIASIGTGQYGRQSVDNIVSLIKQLSAFSGGDGINLRFHTQGLNDLKVSRSALSNLATYLPQIASVNVDQLERISKIDWSNFANLKVDKASLEAIAQMAQTLSSVGGTGGQAEKQKSDFADAKSSMQEYYRLLMQVERARSRTLSITGDKDSGFDTDGNTETAYRELVNQLNAAKDAMDGFREGQEGVNLSKEEYVRLSAIQAEYESKHARELPIIEERGKAAYANLADKVNTYVEQHRYAASRSAEATQALDELQRMANSGDWRGFDELKKKLAEVQNLINSNNMSTETWFQKMKKTFGTRVRSLLAGLSLGKITQSIRDIYKYVVDIDTAMTSLKIVTNENEAALKRYAETAKEAAVNIGASVADIIKSTTTYARLGFSLEEAGQLGALTTAYSKVGDVSVDDATKNITGIVKAYQVSSSELEGVVDKLIYVGRRFAISSSEIGEGMNNAASSLAANGNSLNQAMGILTAANTTVQDISRASTATRTIAARLSASKQELEELGETVEADTVVKLEKAFKAYGLEITNGNGQLKSTYQILGLIAAKWKDLNSDERSAIAGLAAGTRQQDIFYSIIQNWNDAKRVVAEATYASGELSKATEERINSIQGKIDQLKAKLESLSTSVLSSDWVKTLMGALGGLVESLNSFLSLGDGLVGTILLMTTAVVLLQGAYGKLAMSLKGVIIRGREYIATQTGMTTAQAAAIPVSEALAASTLKFVSTGLLGIITIIPRALIALGMWIAGLIKTKFVLHATASSAGSLNAALTALNVNPIVLGITALVAVVAGGAAALTYFAKAASRASQKAREHAEALKENANKAREEAAAIDDLIERYHELAEAGGIDADSRKEIRDIQEQINRLTGKQAADLDLVNGNLDEQLKKLRQIKAEKAAQAADKAKGAFIASRVSANLAYENNLSDAGGAFTRWLLGWVSNNGFGGSDLSVDVHDQQAADILNGIKGFTASSQGGAGFDDRIDINLDVNGAYEAVEVINRGLEALRNADGYDYWNSAVYRELEELLNQYQEYVTSADESTKQYITSLVEAEGYQRQAKGSTVDTWEAYQRLREELIATVSAEEDLTSALSQGIISQKEINEAVDDFLAANYEDLYNQHITSISGYTVALKPLEKILDETQTGFDGLTEVMKSVTEEGYLTADGLSKLLKLEQDHALAGLKLSDILKEEDDGYRLVTDALDQYIESLLEEYKVKGKFATEDDQKNAVANLMNFRRVLVMLTKTQKSATDAAKEQQDALKDQLNAYKELIDLRKKLLKQYEDELRYKKDLAEKETRVSQLQSQLAISQLDTSAAGRAKSRELAKDLQEAQEDLDDFNLEHAIEVVTNELDSQYEEYESYINGKLDAIDQSIQGLDLDVDTDKIEEYLESINTLLEQIEGKEIVQQNDAPQKTEPSGGGTAGGHRQTALTTLTNGTDYSVSGLSNSLSMGKDDISVTIAGNKYNAKVSTKSITSGTTYDGLNGLYGGITPPNGTVAVYDGNAYIVKKGTWRQLVEEDSAAIYDAYQKTLYGKNALQEKLKGKLNAAPPNASIYHSGGIVGDTARLKSTELFAKLLKGEFVATPQMMKQFMTSTLPEIASSGMSGGTNEFNAPLISIQCDNVTQESLPGLKEIVDDAVKQIKKQFDDGLGRAGFHKTVKQIV